MSRREVFPNAPLAMVVAEVQFSYLPELTAEIALSRALDQVREATPVLSIKPMLNVQMGDAAHQMGLVLESRAKDNQITAAISSQALNVAMSGAAYTVYEDSLRPLIERAYDGLIATVPHLLVTRLGLRYLDEIRVAEPPSDLEGWRRWIDAKLLEPASYLSDHSGVAVGARSTWHYALPRGYQLTLNYGPFHGPGVIGPEHPFHRAGGDSTMFVLDVDASWVPSGGVETLTRDELLDRYDDLHEPTKTVFSSAVTEEAKEMFRGNGS